MIGKNMRKIMYQLLLMFLMLKKIYLPYVSRHNSNCERQVIPLMISNGRGQLNLEVKKLSALLREITSKHYSDLIV